MIRRVYRCPNAMEFDRNRGELVLYKAYIYKYIKVKPMGQKKIKSVVFDHYSQAHKRTGYAETADLLIYKCNDTEFSNARKKRFLGVVRNSLQNRFTYAHPLSASHFWLRVRPTGTPL